MVAGAIVNAACGSPLVAILWRVLRWWMKAALVGPAFGLVVRGAVRRASTLAILLSALKLEVAIVMSTNAPETKNVSAQK